ncbi:MAG TPA: DUF930 domain-containing protein [Pseudolabrys sp.]|nr:DUF930 domain-containing protein [Pseudolabrys sp.]
MNLWRIVTAAVVWTLIFTVVNANAADRRFERSLKRLDPITRLEQICDYTAMKKINDSRNPFHPDRVVANAVTQTRISENAIKADGGAFRSRGKWYELSYSCKATADHLKVISFDYHIGPEIPEEKWAAYELWR